MRNFFVAPLISAHYGDSQDFDLRRLDHHQNGLQVATTRSGGVLIDDNFAPLLRESKTTDERQKPDSQNDLAGCHHFSPDSFVRLRYKKRQTGWFPVCRKNLDRTELSLEPQLQRKLNQSRVIHRVVDDAEGRRSIDVLLSAAARASEIELRMVEQVGELSPELKTGALAEREREIFNDRDIRIHETRTIDRSARGRTEFTSGTLRKSTGIEPVLNRMDPGGGTASRISRYRAGLVGIAHLVRPLESASVVREEHSRFVGAIHYEQWESGCGVLDHIQLPVPE